MRRLWNFFQEKMNDFTVRKKLLIFYVFCVLLPLFVTDSVILTILLRGERRERALEMENIASAVQFELSYTFEEAMNMSKNIYANRMINEFLNYEYSSGYDFFEATQKLLDASFNAASFGSQLVTMILYADNDTIVNGGHFYRLSSAQGEEWYEKYQSAEKDLILHFYYVGNEDPVTSIKRRISLVRKLNYYKDSDCEKLIRIDVDYSNLLRKLTNMNYSMTFYVCSGDKILFSNEGNTSYTKDFEHLTGKERIGYELDSNFYGEELRILVLEPTNTVLLQIWQHFPLILFMLAVNILLPWLLTYIINRSFTVRLQELSLAFDAVDAESLKEIESVRGKDEIGSLMRNYNRMVHRYRELIKTVYQDRLKRQEMDIARQNAELQALHSQINPHFLFNVLESIRMHSILKKEDETAGMIERLAILERQNVDWSSDLVTVEEELKFISAYLDLQKYRFGDRLSYEIDVEEGCEDYRLPKLTLVTFAENACVHGVEKKAVPCWIYIRVYRRENWLYLETEDTGDGMEEQQVQELQGKMKNCCIDSLKENEHVGIINACLRLRMTTQGKAEFELESEKGIGTCILIRVPTDCL